MLISLDYDDTYTKDPSLWKEFVRSAKYKGHSVMFVTARFDIETRGIEDAAKEMGIAIHYCNRLPKRKIMKILGYQVDIWIDDWPEMIVEPHDLDWVQAERKEIYTDEELNA